jgi:hypothetical protein
MYLSLFSFVVGLLLLDRITNLKTQGRSYKDDTSEDKHCLKGTPLVTH